MEAESVTFHYGKAVGGNSPGAIDPKEMLKRYDAVALTGGAEAARDLPIPGRELRGGISTSRWTSCRSKIAAFPAGTARRCAGDPG